MSRLRPTTDPGVLLFLGKAPRSLPPLARRASTCLEPFMSFARGSVRPSRRYPLTAIHPVFVDAHAASPCPVNTGGVETASAAPRNVNEIGLGSRGGGAAPSRIVERSLHPGVGTGRQRRGYQVVPTTLRNAPWWS